MFTATGWQPQDAATAPVLPPPDEKLLIVGQIEHLANTALYGRPRKALAAFEAIIALDCNSESIRPGVATAAAKALVMAKRRMFELSVTSRPAIAAAVVKVLVRAKRSYRNQIGGAPHPYHPAASW